MLGWQRFSQLASNLAKLGARRIAVLAAVGVLIVALVVLSAYHLGRPAMQPIYTGLSAQDVTRITATLAEAGIPFDVNEQRSAVLVTFGQTGKARTLLAQKGLPTSARAGYELFDQMGSMGLTSFMQEITRVRALEGEISRTIQSLDGVAAARVHIVLPDAGSFRRDRREPSASVLIRTSERWQSGSSQAIRHIVAAAIPGMKIEHVSLASTDGVVLASGGDERSLGSHKLADLERSMAAELEQRASRTLSSYLGAGNFTVSATVRLDIDRQQTNETVYDPKSRVERSVRVVKQSGSSEDASGKPAVGVEANLPREDAGQTDGDKRRQREDRREELINYELNTKTVQSTREGYRVQDLAVAIVVSRKHVLDQLGPNPSTEAIAERLNDLKRLVAASTGASDSRKDRIEVSIAEFNSAENGLKPVPGPGVLDYLVMNTGTAINALALLGITFVVVWFGLRPVTRMLAVDQPALAVAGGELSALGSADRDSLGLPSPERPGGSSATGAEKMLSGGAADRQVRALPGRSNPNVANRDRLNSLVEDDPVQVSKVFKRWIEEAKET